MTNQDEIRRAFDAAMYRACPGYSIDEVDRGVVNLCWTVAQDMYKAALEAQEPAPSPAVPEAELNYLYWSAYHAGHHDTVEGSYTDVYQQDRFEFWGDQVRACIDSGDMPKTKAMLSAAKGGES